jgi:hypothetical protein
MGKLLPNYINSIVEDVIASDTAYYTFVANPVPNVSGIPAIANNDYDCYYNSDAQMLFGKLLTAADVRPAIDNHIWTSNTVYERYDNTKDISNTTFYAITQPTVAGGTFNIFKCIDNASGAPSTVKPDLVQEKSFTKSDGYTWRYITSISNADWAKFSTSYYSPVAANAAIVTTAAINSGVEVVVVANSGAGYSCYNDGTIASLKPDSVTIQIANTASAESGFYQNNAMYIYNVNSPTAEVKGISSYIANSSGKWVVLDEVANTNNIIPGATKYKISPKVVFESDGVPQPKAYSVVNTSSNTISSIVVVQTGSNISWANVYVQSNPVYGSGANVYAIVPPPGGHGSEPAVELYCKGLIFAAKFNGTETSTIPIEASYNRIGLIRSPHEINQTTGLKNNVPFVDTTFSSVLKADVLSPVTFDIGETVKGQTSMARGTVAFSNSSVVYLTGDKTFANGEYVTSSNTNQTTQISINTRGDIYTKDLKPLYVDNISDVTRNPSLAEVFKLVVQL